MKRLAHTEAMLRNHREEHYSPGIEEPWEVLRCVRCETGSAAVPRNQRLAGLVVCRRCVAEGEYADSADPLLRLKVIIDCLPVSYEARPCGCGGLELVDPDQDGRLV